VATKREPRKKTTPRKRATKRSNSNITAAQKAADQKRQADKDAQSESARKARLASYAKQNDEKASAGNPALEVVDPRTGLKVPASKPGDKAIPGRPVQRGEQLAREGTSDKGNSVKLPGFGLGFNDRKQAEENPPPKPAPQKPLADARFYGSSDKANRDRLVALRNEQIANKVDPRTGKKLKDTGNAVYMGTTKQQIRRAIRGGEFEGGQNRTPESIDVDDVRSADELMSWLSEEKTFNQIRDAAKKAGIDVQSYDDVAKVWEQVVKQAAATYSLSGKKVTPWALLSLRGKSMVNGKPASKTTTSSTIEAMDPAQAKVMLKNSLAQMLGRDPRQDEIEDFIAKAQTIATQNPNVTTTTTQFGFDGEPVSQSSVSRGGSDVVSAKAQLEAERLAENAPDYAQYQAAGVYAPWMFEALSSPI
jgi:hypothetical protein